MNLINTTIYRALFATVSTVFSVAASLFLAVGYIQSSHACIDLTYLNQWEESVIFMLIGIAGLIFGLVSLWMYSRVTRKQFYE